MWKNVHAGRRWDSNPQPFLNMSRHAEPLDQGSRPANANFVGTFSNRYTYINEWLEAKRLTFVILFVLPTNRFIPEPEHKIAFR